MPEEIRSLVLEGGLTPEEVARRKAFLEFRGEDEQRLRELDDLAKRYANDVIEAFYTHVLSQPESAAFFRDPAVLERVKRLQVRYFLRLTSGVYDEAYVEDRLKIGTVHESSQLPVKLYLGMYGFYLRTVAARLRDAHKDAPERVLDTYLSLEKLVFFDIGLAIETYLLRREQTIRDQAATLSELVTPVLQVRPGLLILPIVGPVSARRAQRLQDQLLTAIRANRARFVVIDITGVESVDAHVAGHLVNTVEAARLVGALCIASGLSADVAQTLVEIRVDPSKLRTVGDLQQGIEEGERFLGYPVLMRPLAPLAGATSTASNREESP